MLGAFRVLCVLSVYQQAFLILLALSHAAFSEPLTLIFHLRFDSELVHAELIRKARGVDIDFDRARYPREHLRRRGKIFHLSVVGGQVYPLTRPKESILSVVCRAVYDIAEALSAVFFDYLVGILAAGQTQNFYLHARGAEYSERAGGRLLPRLICVIREDYLIRIA